MKNLLATIILLVLSTSLFAQEKRLEQVEENLYNYKVYNNGKLQQSGWYAKIDDKFVATGLWKDEYGTMALYDDGQMVWIKPKGEKKYTYQEIELHRLRRKVARLEEALTSL